MIKARGTAGLNKKTQVNTELPIDAHSLEKESKVLLISGENRNLLEKVVKYVLNCRIFM